MPGPRLSTDLATGGCSRTRPGPRSSCVSSGPPWPDPSPLRDSYRDSCARRRSVLSALGLDLEPCGEDDGGAGCGAPAQGPEEVFRPDQAALVDLVPRIPGQELDPGPEAGLVVAPGTRRVVRIVNALAADVTAFGNASAAFLHHFADQAVLQRFTGLDPAAEQVPVPLAVIIAGAQDDHPRLGEADAVCLIGVRRFRPERGIEPGEGHLTAPVGDFLDRSRLRFCQALRVAAGRRNAFHCPDLR